MKKYSTVIASFVIMLCIGSVYGWSIIASELIDKYGFSASQAQVIFGVLIAIFPFSMIFVGRAARKIRYRYIAFASGSLFIFGYYLASLSSGSFSVILLGIGVIAGISTGLGYWVSLTAPVEWFPERKGLITGIAAAGFGLGAVMMSKISEVVLANGHDVLYLLKALGISYGLIILGFSNLIFRNKAYLRSNSEPIPLRRLLETTIFKTLFAGIFLGTFAGLLIIGSLQIIGKQGYIGNHYLVMGVSFFAISNFLGRLTWGILSDYIGASISIFLALLFQALAIILLNIITLSELRFLILAACIGFGFGGNFVLFAKETAQVFGVQNLGVVYPYVFLGYAIAGILGPLSGGYLFDLFGSFYSAINLASIMSLSGSLLFLWIFLRTKTIKKMQAF